MEEELSRGLDDGHAGTGEPEGGGSSADRSFAGLAVMPRLIEAFK